MMPVMEDSKLNAFRDLHHGQRRNIESRMVQAPGLTSDKRMLRDRDLLPSFLHGVLAEATPEAPHDIRRL